MKFYSFYWLICMNIICLLPLSAQTSLEGIVKDAEGNILVGAHAILQPLEKIAVTDDKGQFFFRNLSPQTYSLQVQYLGYATFSENIALKSSDKSKFLSVVLHAEELGLQPVYISALRAKTQTPVAFSNISQEFLQKNNFGQDMPLLLSWTPSAISTSDAGNGVGYTGFSVRGSDPSRINVTINGIPLNDSESQIVYWVDLPDFAASTESVQIQRGAGTSTNGAAAFGASVNLQTDQSSSLPYVRISSGAGSFATFRNSLSLGSGKLGKYWHFSGRISAIQSNGYIDRAKSNLLSFFGGINYQRDKQNFALNLFSGKEKTYQAWYGVPLEYLQTHRTYNPAGEKSDGTYYDNQTDNYIQTHAQLLHTYHFSPRLRLQSALHFTRGKGYYEEYKEDVEPEDYGIYPPFDTVADTYDLIRRRWLDNYFAGFNSALIYQKNGWKYTYSLAANQYWGNHFGEVIDLISSVNLPGSVIYYDNDAKKTDLNTFVKAEGKITAQWFAFADLQVRSIAYTYEGIADNTFAPQTQKATHFFFNPKLGISYQWKPQTTAYASWAVAQHEPNRNDYVDAPLYQQPQSEKMNDLEAGLRHQSSVFSWSANGYYMRYKNQLALDGGINDVGEYTRINISDSYRAGIEWESAWKINSKWQCNANVTFSQNKIKSFTEVIDAFVPPNYAEKVRLTYKNTDLALSPNITAALLVNYVVLDKPKYHFAVDWQTKYVGKQYIDNTSNENGDLFSYISNTSVNNRSLSAYSYTNLIFHLQRKKTGNFPKIGLDFALNNLFDAQYVSNAYVYRYIAEGDNGNTLYEGSGYFPQAGRNFLVQLHLNF
ncbi:MAG: TonB-dependent receptor [Chitinophagales bacterium]|nr:TonB-dependent receptor [Bacteroidota bacterium]MCB9042415.1 TonB-dependent receptor [Chitinophagales bacterium]